MKILKWKLLLMLPALAFLACSLAARPALAAPGDLDPAFNGGTPAIIDLSPSSTLTVHSAAVDPDTGDILWAADAYTSSDEGEIAAYKPDGTLDTAVGSGGEITLTADQAGFTGGGLQFFAMAVDAQGRILAVGAVGVSGDNMVLARFNPDGTLDTSFGTDGTGIVTDALNGFSFGTGLSLTADGHILVTGSSADSSGSTTLLTVWRFNPDGTSDSSFGTSGHAQVASIANDSGPASCFPALQPDGALIAGCPFTASGGSLSPWKIVRLKPDGSVDADFGTSGFVTGAANQELAGLALAPDGGFVISQEDLSGSSHGFSIRRFQSDGSLDRNFNSGNPLPFSFSNTTSVTLPLPLAVQPDGKILGATYDGAAFAVCRVLPDGTLDSSFGGGSYEAGCTGFNFYSMGYVPEPAAVLLQGNGEIAVAGNARGTSSGSPPKGAFVTRFLSDDPWNLAPDALSFDDVARAPLGQALASNAATVSGVAIGSETSGISVALAVQGGQYSTTGTAGPFMGTASGVNVAQINVGDALALQQMTPNSASTATATNVVVGGFWAPNNYEVPLGNAATTTWTTTTDTPPTANDGTLDATAGQGTTGTLDADNPSGGSLIFSIVTQPSHGTLSLNDATTGDYNYTADSGYSGDDSFTWKVNDGVADSNMATVNVTVSTASPPSPPHHGGGGGGSLGGLTLALLALFGFGVTAVRRAVSKSCR